MDILKDFMVNADITFFEKLKIQAQVLVPVIRAFRAELGEEPANQILRTALRDWSNALFLDIGGNVAGSPQKKWSTITQAVTELTNKDVEVDVLRQDEEAFNVNITSCRYAEFFKQLNEPDLGALLTCELDIDVAEVGGAEVEFERTQTIMKGASYCDFRFKMKKGEA